MKELLNKISSYNIFNYLLPGAVFIYLLRETTELNLIQDDLVIAAFLYYFVGMIISRLGSLIIEPLLKRLKIIHFADYQDFVRASQKDSKLALFSEQNNMYRTLIALPITLGLLMFYLFLQDKWSALEDWNNLILLTTLTLIFILSYRKQTQYIVKRIKAGAN